MQNSTDLPTGKYRRLFLRITVFLVVLLSMNFCIQGLICHDSYSYHPDYEKENLGQILKKDVLSEKDYERIFLQTGIAKAGMERLWEKGRNNALSILECMQRDFFHTPTSVCKSLLPLKITCEDRLRNSENEPTAGTDLVPLKPGDLFISLSTHTLGWRHGHAGLVVDTDPITTLEAAVLGENTKEVNANHWRTYTNFLIFEVKDTSAALKNQVVHVARSLLTDIPYNLLSGVFGPKAPDTPKSAQCAYLPWYAWKHTGIDLDSDRGKIVTVMDLLTSPHLELVQMYGLDPLPFLSD